MNNARVMNTLWIFKAVAIIKFSFFICSAVLLSGCAGNKIVSMESSVKQLQELNDHDRDGVVETRDRCTDTVVGASIDNNGCGKQSSQIVPLKLDIKFAHNTYTIPASAFPKIQQLATYLKTNVDLKIVIEGHTSKVGSAPFNQILSNKRAQAVESVLINEFNIEPDRVSSIGYGFERLEDVADTEAAHATNRRTMVELSQAVNIDEMIWTIYTVDQVQ